MADRQDFQTENMLPAENIALITVDENKSLQEEMARLLQDPNVEYVQPNFVYHILMTAPDDTHFDDQRWLNNVGQVIDGQTGTVGADIDRLAAMDIRSGDGNQNTTGTIVAVIDVGLRYTHPEFSGQLRNGANCRDSQNVIIGWCTFGFDTADEDKNPWPSDQDSHGTHIAGIIWAKTNNGTGVVGINPRTKLMAIRAGSEKSLYTIDIIEAISFAKYNGAKIINASRWTNYSSCQGARPWDQGLYDAIKNFPWLFIAAAGNGTGGVGQQHLSGRYLNPADYNTDTSCRSGLDNIISVAATNNIDYLASFSDYGSNINIAAPGDNIYSSVLNGNYNRMNGTSMATPFVAAVASLARSMRPELSYLDIKNAIINQAEYIETLSGYVAGGKRLNAFQTLQYLYQAQILWLSGYLGTWIDRWFISGAYISGTQSYFQRNPPYYTGTLSGYQVSINFSGWNLLDTWISTTGIVVSLSGDGKYVFSVYPILSGNTTGNTLSYTFYVDNSAPTATTPSPVSPLRNGTLSRSPASDVGAGMTAWYYMYSIYLSGNNIPVLTGKASATWYILQWVWTLVTINVNLTGNGDYIMTLASCDAASNCASANTGIFTINRPLPFSFTAQTDKELSTTYVSNEVTMTWLVTWATMIIQGWSYSINGWTGQTTTGIVYNGDKIKILLTSSSSYSSTTIATLNIGGLTGNFSVTTKSAPSWGWGGWGGWGWTLVKNCTIADLICSWTTTTGGVYIKKNLVTCEWGNLWMSCIITWTVIQTGINSGNIQYHILWWGGWGFSQELNQAYSYAHEIWITTVPDIEKANLMWTLIREHLAKMISNFAINVLDKKPNTWMNCEFEDMQSETLEMRFYAKLACQLWLMWLASDGIPNSNFYPEVEVTRAQFGTVLSRALRGDKYNDATAENYFTEHLAALNDVWIMKNINDPFNLELRWYVMLMMMRAAE